MTGMRVRMKPMGAPMNDVPMRIRRPDAPMSEMRPRIFNMGVRVSDMHARMREKRVRRRVTGARMKPMNSRIPRLGARISGIDARTSGMGARMNGMDARMMAVCTPMSDVDGRMREVRAPMSGVDWYPVGRSGYARGALALFRCITRRGAPLGPGLVFAALTWSCPGIAQGVALPPLPPPAEPSSSPDPTPPASSPDGVAVVLAPDRASQRPTVWVHLDAPDEARLQEGSAGGHAWAEVCAPPCDRRLPTDATYRVVGRSMRPSESFVLHGSDGNRETVHVNDVSTAWFNAGVVTAGLGFVVPYVVATWELDSSLFTGRGQEPMTPQRRDAIGASLVVGAACLVVGAVILVTHWRSGVSTSIASAPASSLSRDVGPAQATWKDATAEDNALPREVTLPLFRHAF
jgi:hypothetical protein